MTKKEFREINVGDRLIAKKSYKSPDRIEAIIEKGTKYEVVRTYEHPLLGHVISFGKRVWLFWCKGDWLWCEAIVETGVEKDCFEDLFEVRKKKKK